MVLSVEDLESIRAVTREVITESLAPIITRLDAVDRRIVIMYVIVLFRLILQLT
jgi:hypothetical protein